MPLPSPKNNCSHSPVVEPKELPSAVVGNKFVPDNLSSLAVSIKKVMVSAEASPISIDSLPVPVISPPVTVKSEAKVPTPALVKVKRSDPAEVSKTTKLEV